MRGGAKGAIRWWMLRGLSYCIVACQSLSLHYNALTFSSFQKINRSSSEEDWHLNFPLQRVLLLFASQHIHRFITCGAYYVYTLEIGRALSLGKTDPFCSDSSLLPGGPSVPNPREERSAVRERELLYLFSRPWGRLRMSCKPLAFNMRTSVSNQLAWLIKHDGTIGFRLEIGAHFLCAKWHCYAGLMLLSESLLETFFSQSNAATAGNLL